MLDAAADGAVGEDDAPQRDGDSPGDRHSTPTVSAYIEPNQPGQAPAHPDLGPARSLIRHFARRQRLPGLRHRHLQVMTGLPAPGSVAGSPVMPWLGPQRRMPTGLVRFGAGLGRWGRRDGNGDADYADH